MSERIIGSLRARNLHKKPEVLAAAEQTRKLRRFEAGRGESGSEEVENKNFPDPRNPEEIIQNYINGLEAMMTSKHPDALPRKLEKLKQMLYDRCVITTDPALFEGYFTSQAQQARDMGLEYREPIEAEKQQRITSIVEEQKQSLDVWVDYLGYRYLLGAFRPRISGHGACFLIDISREHLPLRCLNLGEQSVKGFVLLRRRRPLSQSCA